MPSPALLLAEPLGNVRWNLLDDAAGDARSENPGGNRGLPDAATVAPASSPPPRAGSASPGASPGASPASSSRDASPKQQRLGDAPPRAPAVWKQLLQPQTVLLLATYLVFQLANISFNSLYPIFSAAPRPTGRDLPPGQIGLLLSFAGAATLVFQVTLFQPLKAVLGNLGTYRAALCGIALAMLAMPWTTAQGGGGGGWADGPSAAALQIGALLVAKNLCAVGGLSSVMLLINNAAPAHETLGTLNGLAQTLSAAGRSVGPFVAGALFSLSARIARPRRGELLAWCVLGGVAAAGWVLTLLLSGRGLESADGRWAEAAAAAAEEEPAREAEDEET